MPSGTCTGEGWKLQVVMVGYLSVAILSLAVYCVSPKRLPLYEILAIWLAVLSVNALLSSYLLFNLEWMGVKDGVQAAVARTVYKEVITPLVLVWVFDWIRRISKRWFVLFAVLGAAAALMAGRVLLSWSGIVSFILKGWWGCAVKETVLFFAAAASLYFVRYLMRKDGIPFDSNSSVK